MSSEYENCDRTPSLTSTSVSSGSATFLNLLSRDFLILNIIF